MLLYTIKIYNTFTVPELGVFRSPVNKRNPFIAIYVAVSLISLRQSRQVQPLGLRISCLSEPSKSVDRITSACVGRSAVTAVSAQVCNREYRQ